MFKKGSKKALLGRDLVISLLLFSNMNVDGWFDGPGHIRPNDIADGLDREYWSDLAEDISGTYLDYGGDDEPLDVEPRDVVEVLEDYDPKTEDSKMEEAVRARFRSKLLDPHLRDEDVPDYVEDCVAKTFRGLEGEYRLVDQGLARSVFRGPVRSEEERAVYVPNEGLEPDLYDSDLKNRMAMVAVSMQNTERMNNFVSDTFQPLIIEDNGKEMPIVAADFRPLSDVPSDRHEEAHELAELYQERADSGDIITLYTLEDTNSEFILGDDFRRDNVRFDTERGKIVVADAGEIDPEVSREDFERLLEDRYLELVESS
jgi:hypothetical protein